MKEQYKIFLDSNVYYGAKFLYVNDNFKFLYKLNADQKLQLYINEIVKMEVIKNIEEIYDLLNSKIKKLKKELNITIDWIPNIDDLKSKTIDNFNKFLGDMHVVYLDIDNVKPSKVFSKYFKVEEPFNLSKKEEFPDAFIVDSIIASSENNEMILVSNDDGVLASYKGMKFKFLSDLKKYILKCEDEFTKEILAKFTEFYFKNSKEIDKGLLDVIIVDNIILDGNEYDRKGVCGGHEYDGYELPDCEIENVDTNDFAVEYVSENLYNVFINANVRIKLLCTEFDIDNSYWDSEEKEYIIKKYNDFEEIHIKELHYIIGFDYDENDIVIRSYCNNEEIELDQSSRIKINELKNVEHNDD